MDFHETCNTEQKIIYSFYCKWYNKFTNNGFLAINLQLMVFVQYIYNKLFCAINLQIS